MFKVISFSVTVGGENNSPSTIIIIVCVILGLLFLGLLAFIIYHYRKGLHKVILKSKGNSIIVETSFDRQQKHMLLRSRSSEKSDTSLNVEANGKVEYARVCFESAGELLRWQKYYSKLTEITTAQCLSTLC